MKYVFMFRLDIFVGNLGGYPAGTNDITMARKGILRVLPVGEMILADEGYIGEPTKIITPIEDDSTNFNRQHTLIMARHDGINKMIEGFKCMSDTWRHGCEAHICTLYTVVVLTQIMLKNGKPMHAPYIP